MIEVLPAAPSAPVRAPDYSTRDERRFASQVQEWLVDRSVPAESVVWLPHWNAGRLIEVESLAHLEALIAGIEVAGYAGLRRHLSDARWAQVKHMPDATRYLELHPYAHDRPSRPFVWTSLPELTARDAAALAWDWVRSSTAR